ncbi:DUF58 domain-containing protein [Rhodoblastus acidophilus]|uniref:DUF58 domain-containing protein n=1 Tax=Candidatus Rhodoblastus alkanivorans TaxID=2954117 RepID=UPI001FAA7FDC|nr:DUF58 domain-containing protein [Candidatus Rhodoblastus alkanivorans]MCI4677634.1 DUF58 domain-containing protein [Candidatus Rhodoblastus alkanivorans]MDI4639940.1 DUF58 domain-containing protein [Rhodoblastus acidophilus]
MAANARNGYVFRPREAARPDHEKRIQALDLARRLPALTLSARQAAASAQAGLHGRRRAGAGENFWQFRPFIPGEAAQNVDWRRSARDDRLYVRQREREAAQVLWVWADLSGSMNYCSPLSAQSKLDRALILALALADSAVRAGERAGWLGLTRLSAARDIVDSLAVALVAEARLNGELFEDLPQAAAPLRPREKAALIGDFLVEPAAFAACLQRLSIQGARGHVLMVYDPAEEAFPFSGQTEFYDEAGDLLRAGRAEDYVAPYRARLAAHREALSAAARAQGWTFAVHSTVRPASEALLNLRLALTADGTR